MTLTEAQRLWRGSWVDRIVPQADIVNAADMLEDFLGYRYYLAYPPSPQLLLPLRVNES